MNLKKQAINGVIWTFAQQFSVQIINFVVQVILARLLMPEDFGLIAMLMVFMSIGLVLMDGGMTHSLIRMKNPDQLDYSTVFVTNLMVSIVAYSLVFAGAPFIAGFYAQELLKDVLRVFALTFIIQSFAAVHVAKFTKEMDFKIQMKLQIPSTIIAAIVGVGMAYAGYGIWSLVWLNLTQKTFFSLQNWLFVQWKPSFAFDKQKFSYHFSFGYKLTLSSLLEAVYNDAHRIVIGKFFSPAQVGYFNQAETMRLFPVQQIDTVVGKVTYPMFADIHENAKLRLACKTVGNMILFVAIPVMLLLILIAEEGFLFLFGEKWLPAVPYFQILAIASMIRPISNYNLNILKVKGRTDLFLKAEVLKKTMGGVAIALGLPFGVMGLATSLTMVSFAFTAINMVYCGKLIAYSPWDQARDFSKLFMIGIVTFCVSYLIYAYILKGISEGLLTMGSVSVCFVAIYLLLVLFFKRDLMDQLKSILKK